MFDFHDRELNDRTSVLNNDLVVNVVSESSICVCLYLAHVLRVLD